MHFVYVLKQVILRIKAACFEKQIATQVWEIMFIKEHFHSWPHFILRAICPQYLSSSATCMKIKKNYRWRKFCKNLAKTCQNLCFLFSFQNNNVRTDDLPGTLRYGLTGSFMAISQWEKVPALRPRTSTVTDDLWRITAWPSYMMIYVLFRDVWILILIFYRVLSLCFPFQSPIAMITVQTKIICDSTIFNVWSNI